MRNRWQDLAAYSWYQWNWFEWRQMTLLRCLTNWIRPAKLHFVRVSQSHDQLDHFSQIDLSLDKCFHKLGAKTSSGVGAFRANVRISSRQRRDGHIMINTRTRNGLHEEYVVPAMPGQSQQQPYAHIQFRGWCLSSLAGMPRGSWFAGIRRTIYSTTSGPARRLGQYLAARCSFDYSHQEIWRWLLMSQKRLLGCQPRVSMTIRKILSVSR